jgi:uncharacterized protein
MKKKTLIIGASTNPDRYSFKAANLLSQYNNEIELFGLRKGILASKEIATDWSDLNLENLDTITLYVGPQNQEELFNKVIEAHPKRVIFNPGTENEEFYKLLNHAGIEFEEACTLVLLNTRQY